VAYSDFGYIDPTRLPDFIRTMASVTDEALAAQFISDAERIIDAYVGPGPRFHNPYTFTTAATLVSGGTTLSGVQGASDSSRPNYYAVGGVYVEVVGGAAAASLIGQRRRVVSSSGADLTLASGFAADLASGAELYFTQDSAFPRAWDQDLWGAPKLPTGLDAAVAAQVEYGISFGSEGFGLSDSNVVTDESGDVTSRTYGSGYSESRDPRRREGMAVWVGPRARVLLRRLLNSGGWLRS